MAGRRPPLPPLLQKNGRSCQGSKGLEHADSFPEQPLHWRHRGSLPAAFNPQSPAFRKLAQPSLAQAAVQNLGASRCPCGALNRLHEVGYQLNDPTVRVIVAAGPVPPVVDKVRVGTVAGDWRGQGVAALAAPAGTAGVRG